MGDHTKGGLVGTVVDRVADRVFDGGRDRRGRLVDGERFAAPGRGGVVAVAVVGRLIRVGARAEGRAGRRVGGRVRGDVGVVGADHVGVARAGGAGAVAEQGVGDQAAAVCREAAGQVAQRRRVMGDHTKGGLVGTVVDRVADRVFDGGRDRRGRLVDGERFAAAGRGGVVAVAVVGRLIRVGARAEGRAGRRVGGRVRGDVGVVGADHVGVARAGGAGAVAEQGVGDQAAAVCREAAGQVAQRRRVMGDHTKGGLVGTVVDRVADRVFDGGRDRRGRLVDGERFAAAAGRGGVVAVAVVGRLIRVGARAEGRRRTRISGSIRGDVDALSRDDVGVARARRAGAVAEQGVGDRVRAVEAEGADLARQRRRVMRDHTQGRLVRARVDCGVGSVLNHGRDRGRSLGDRQRLTGRIGRGGGSSCLTCNGLGRSNCRPTEGLA